MIPEGGKELKEQPRLPTGRKRQFKLNAVCLGGFKTQRCLGFGDSF